MPNVPFEIKCCNKTFNAKRYRVKPLFSNIKQEEFKRINCPECGAIVLEFERHYILSNGDIDIVKRRLKNREALNYHTQFDSVTQIINTFVEKGAESLSNWYYGKNNKVYDLNDKARTQHLSC